MICKCPAGAALPDVPAIKCSESFGQVQKVAFQRLMKDDGSKNSFTSEKVITALASWTPLLSAEDSTKVVVSPYIQAPTAEAGAARTFGGGNETLGGVEEIIGREPTPFTGVIRKAPQEVIKALKEMQCESWGDNLGIFISTKTAQLEPLRTPQRRVHFTRYRYVRCLSAIRRWADWKPRTATQYNGCFCRIGRTIWRLLPRRLTRLRI